MDLLMRMPLSMCLMDPIQRPMRCSRTRMALATVLALRSRGAIAWQVQSTAAMRGKRQEERSTAHRQIAAFTTSSTAAHGAVVVPRRCARTATDIPVAHRCRSRETGPHLLAAAFRRSMRSSKPAARRRHGRGRSRRAGDRQPVLNQRRLSAEHERVGSRSVRLQAQRRLRSRRRKDLRAAPDVFLGWTLLRV